MSSSIKSGLRPIFDFIVDQNEYALKMGDIQICICGTTYSGNGQVVLQLLPRPSIVFKGEVRNVPPSVVMKTTFDIAAISEFKFLGRSIDGFSGGMGGALEGQSNEVYWHPKAEPIVGSGDESTRFTSVRFHLFNFRDFTVCNGTSETRDAATVAIHEIDLSGLDLHVRIHSLFESVESQKQLRREGGWRITHVGDICHSSGSPITGSQALEYLGLVGQCLSFANGRRTIPVCACGLNEQNEGVWEAWSSPASDTDWADSWCDNHHYEELQALFTSYMRRTEDDTWRKAINEAIYWYLNANSSRRGIDAGIILAQSALELLAYTYAVLDKRLLLPKGFKKLWASDKLRLLFSSIGIPTAIPPECSSILQIMAQNNKFKWTDLPHALTEIRNSLVHPDKTNRDALSDTYHDAWKASLWCLELTILRLCDYSGTYSNRLKLRHAGQVESVPWFANV